MGANRYCLFYPFYRLSDLFFFSSGFIFEEDRVLSGAGILGVGHLCQYLCRQPEGRADKPEERTIVFAPTVTVKSSPMQAEPTCLFCMKERRSLSRASWGDWNEIEMEDGNVGWMPQQRHGNHLGFCDL